MASNGIKFLVVGTGEIVKKLAPTWHLYQQKGVLVYAVDIRDDPTGLEALYSGAFHNWKNPEQLRALIATARDDPFDFAYLSTFPELHVMTALRLDFLASKFILPKPVDSNFDAIRTLYLESKRNRAMDIGKRALVHDHYRNKPLTAKLKDRMKTLHGQNGYLKKIQLYITEHNSIQDEWERSESLECGIILDLAPHALSVICELVPETLQWYDNAGHLYKRRGRRFEIVTAIRGRDNLCILQRLGAETFGAIHLRVFEDIDFTPKGTDNVARTIRNRPFDILVVVGKGVNPSRHGEPRDLKAIQLEFDGHTVRGNFDTGAIAGVVLERALEKQLEEQYDVSHRGLNLPLMQLAEARFSVEDLSKGQMVSPFQSFDEAYLIAELLDGCLQHSTARDPFPYGRPSTIAELLNRCIARGLERMWAVEDEEPANLIFGRLPDDPIP